MALDRSAPSRSAGRSEVDELEAVLSVTNADADEAVHAVRDNAEAIFTWDYTK
jgi:hypothetical protein